MALAFYFAPTTPVMTAQQYDECIKRLKKAGAAHPPGRVYHACFGTKDRVCVFDIWTSKAEFDKFGQVLLPILNDLGTSPGQPSVMDVHNVIVPPAARPRKAAKKAAPARRAASKKGAKKKSARSRGRSK